MESSDIQVDHKQAHPSAVYLWLDCTTLKLDELCDILSKAVEFNGLFESLWRLNRCCRCLSHQLFQPNSGNIFPSELSLRKGKPGPSLFSNVKKYSLKDIKLKETKIDSSVYSLNSCFLWYPLGSFLYVNRINPSSNSSKETRILKKKIQSRED